MKILGRVLTFDLFRLELGSPSGIAGIGVKLGCISLTDSGQRVKKPEKPT